MIHRGSGLSQLDYSLFKTNLNRMKERRIGRTRCAGLVWYVGLLPQRERSVFCRLQEHARTLCVRRPGH